MLSANLAFKEKGQEVMFAVYSGDNKLGSEESRTKLSDMHQCCPLINCAGKKREMIFAEKKPVQIAVFVLALWDYFCYQASFMWLVTHVSSCE